MWVGCGLRTRESHRAVQAFSETDRGSGDLERLRIKTRVQHDRSEGKSLSIHKSHTSDSLYLIIMISFAHKDKLKIQQIVIITQTPAWQLHEEKEAVRRGLVTELQLDMCEYRKSSSFILRLLLDV